MPEHDLSLGRLLRRPGPPKPAKDFPGVQVDNPRLAAVLSAGAELLVLHEGTLHAEGPVWDRACGLLFWSDVPNRRLLSLHPDGHLVHCEHGRRCISRSVAPGEQPEPIVAHFEGRRLNSPNDLAVAPDGTIWFADPTFGILMPNQGSIVEPELDHRSVYRFNPRAGELRRMADFEQPNGVGFSPNGDVLYVSDTALSLDEIPNAGSGTTHEIIAFDVAADGILSNRRFFCHTDHGYPDGFAIDQRGWVWTSAADGVHIWSAERERLGFIPTRQTVSNLCFGGRGGKRLFMAATKQLLAIDLAG
jgi:gluconolactonase